MMAKDGQQRGLSRSCRSDEQAEAAGRQHFESFCLFLSGRFVVFSCKRSKDFVKQGAPVCLQFEGPAVQALFDGAAYDVLHVAEPSQLKGGSAVLEADELDLVLQIFPARFYDVHIHRAGRLKVHLADLPDTFRLRLQGVSFFCFSLQQADEQCPDALDIQFFMTAGCRHRTGLTQQRGRTDAAVYGLHAYRCTTESASFVEKVGIL